jgi:hypothetical protein
MYSLFFIVVNIIYDYHRPPALAMSALLPFIALISNYYLGENGASLARRAPKFRPPPSRASVRKEESDKLHDAGYIFIHVNIGPPFADNCSPARLPGPAHTPRLRSRCS